jgi:Phosphotransferase enzyme family
MPFPTATDDAGWDALLDDERALMPGVTVLLSRHGLAQEPRQRYDSGSLPVYAVGSRHVLKLFPPSEQQHAAVEARVLAAVQGALPIPTPQLIAADSHDGWPYLLMSQLRGQRLVDAWPALSLSERGGIVDTLGEAIAALHAIDTTPLAGLPPRWDDFIAAQRDSAAERQSKRRLDAYWLERVPEFLQRWMPPPAARHVLLHTEIMREHLMLDLDGAASPHWPASSTSSRRCWALPSTSSPPSACSWPAATRAPCAACCWPMAMRRTRSTKRCNAASWPTRCCTATATCAGTSSACRPATQRHSNNWQAAGGRCTDREPPH